MQTPESLNLRNERPRSLPRPRANDQDPALCLYRLINLFFFLYCEIHYPSRIELPIDAPFIVCHRQRLPELTVKHNFVRVAALINHGINLIFFKTTASFVGNIIFLPHKMTDYNAFKVPDLKAMLGQRKLLQTGNKQALIARLQEDDEKNSSESKTDGKSGTYQSLLPFFFL